MRDLRAHSRCSAELAQVSQTCSRAQTVGTEEAFEEGSYVRQSFGLFMMRSREVTQCPTAFQAGWLLLLYT